MSTINLTFNEPEVFKDFCKQLRTEDREKIITIAKEQGIKWKENAEFKINWMRCAMAINKLLQKGGKFIVPVSVIPNQNGERPKDDPKPKNMTKSVPNTNEYYETPEGDIIFGNRFKGNPLPGQARILYIDNDRKWGGTYWAVMECSYHDRDIVKHELNGRFDPSTKTWRIPLSQIMEVKRLFKDVEIVRNVAPLVKRVFEIKEFVEK